MNALNYSEHEKMRSGLGKSEEEKKKKESMAEKLSNITLYPIQNGIFLNGKFTFASKRSQVVSMVAALLLLISFVVKLSEFNTLESIHIFTNNSESLPFLKPVGSMSRLDFPWDYNRTMSFFPLILRVFHADCSDMEVNFDIFSRDANFSSINQTQMICSDGFSNTGATGLDSNTFIEFRVSNQTQYDIYDFITNKTNSEKQNFYFNFTTNLT